MLKKEQKRQAITKISNVLYTLLSTAALGLTQRQTWMLNYLHLQWCENKERWVSPTEIGQEYGKWLHYENEFVPHSYHSAAASKPIRGLVEKGIVERNERGLYRYCA
jgi:hypothetical protein